jgi:hypothetical protein
MFIKRGMIEGKILLFLSSQRYNQIDATIMTRLTVKLVRLKIYYVFLSDLLVVMRVMMTK